VLVPDERIATHSEPAWRDRSDYIIRVDLADHGMPGSSEQLWARRVDEHTFEICCIPFFTYGIALGDLVEWTEADQRATVRGRSGHRNLRIAFCDRSDATDEHESLHGKLVRAGCLVEFSGHGFGAVDLGNDEQREAALAVLAPYVEAERITWEWGDDDTNAA
jgi:Domain of unknown function (DUF4265)